jgi:hypothetical protein
MSQSEVKLDSGLLDGSVNLEQLLSSLTAEQIDSLYDDIKKAKTSVYNVEFPNDKKRDHVVLYSITHLREVYMQYLTMWSFSRYMYKVLEEDDMSSDHKDIIRTFMDKFLKYDKDKHMGPLKDSDRIELLKKAAETANDDDCDMIDDEFGEDDDVESNVDNSNSEESSLPEATTVNPIAPEENECTYNAAETTTPSYSSTPGESEDSALLEPTSTPHDLRR